MSEQANKMRQYLLDSVDIEQGMKVYAMNFCKKNEYLNGLRDTVVNEIHETVTVGYGNVNSKICIVFSDENSFQLVKPVIQEILEKYRLNLWDIYVTFVNKTVSDYPGKYAYLVNELYAVGSQVIYVIDKDDNIFNNIQRAFSVMNVPSPTNRMYFVSTLDICSTDEEVKKDLGRMFKFLINYRN